MKFSPDGKYLASGSSDQTVRLLDRYDNYSPVETFNGHAGAVSSISFSPDGDRIVSASRDGTIRIWGTTCKPGHYGTNRNCALCPPGTYTDKKGMTSCTLCDPGEFQKYAGAVNCEACAAGNFFVMSSTAIINTTYISTNTNRHLFILRLIQGPISRLKEKCSAKNVAPAGIVQALQMQEDVTVGLRRVESECITTQRENTMRPRV